MKRVWSLIIILSLVLVIGAGCEKTSDIRYKDGKFTAEDDLDDQGWKGEIEIKIRDGKMVEVDYDEVNREGDEKTEDEEYSKSMEESSGVSPEDAYEQLEDALVKTQDPNRIDAVSGATTSSERFKKLAKEALDKSK